MDTIGINARTNAHRESVMEKKYEEKLFLSNFNHDMARFCGEQHLYYTVSLLLYILG